MYTKSKFYVLLFIFVFTCMCPYTVHAISSDFSDSVPADIISDTEDAPDAETSSFPDDTKDGTEDIPDGMPDDFIIEQELEEKEEIEAKEDHISDKGEKYEFDQEDFKDHSETDQKNDVMQEATLQEPDSSFENDNSSNDLDLPADIPVSADTSHLDFELFEKSELSSDASDPSKNPDALSDLTEIEPFFFEKNFEEYTVTEGLLLLIFVVIFCKFCIDMTAKFMNWRMY